MLQRPVCGDWVHWEHASSGQSGGLVTAILPRHSVLTRQDERLNQRVLAANIDHVLLVLAARPEPELELIDRYLVAAELLKLKASLIFNKSDLLDTRSRQDWQTRLATYEQLGYSLHFTSIKSDPQMAAVRTALQGQTGIVVGQSGVGKSSLIETLIPDLQLRTQRLSDASGKGQHTTTTTRLYPVPEIDAFIIDSPGVRDFMLWPLKPKELVAGFKEFHETPDHCRFSDCLHLVEPGCAIRARVESGLITTQRYRSYCQLVQGMQENRS
jgi:ribosome biogenesis GTPase